LNQRGTRTKAALPTKLFQDNEEPTVFYFIEKLGERTPPGQASYIRPYEEVSESNRRPDRQLSPIYRMGESAKTVRQTITTIGRENPDPLFITYYYLF